MKDKILPKRYIARQLAKNTKSDNPKQITKVMKDAGVVDPPAEKQITNHLKHKYLPALIEEFEKEDLPIDEVRRILISRYAHIHDISLNPEISKRNIDSYSALNALHGIGKVYQIIRDANINIANFVVSEDEKKEYAELIKRVKESVVSQE